MINGQEQIWQIRSPNWMNLHVFTELRLSLNMDGVDGISNIIAILAHKCKVHVHLESTSTWLVKYDKFWRFGFKSILQNSSVQKILLPRQIGSSLQFQVKEQPAAAEAVAKEETEEVGGSGTIGAGVEERLWSILEVGPLKWPFGNPCDNVTASSLSFDSGCCHRNLSRLQPRQFFQPLWLEVEVLSWKSWNVSKMNLDVKWTRTDLTDQIAKLNELTCFHRVAFEPKMDGVDGISNIIAILAPQMQGPRTFGINLYMTSQIRQVLKIRV